MKNCAYLWPLVSFIVFAATLFFNYAAGTGLVSEQGVGEVSNEYSLEITPASWTFTIWAFIYIWQFLWIVYTLYLSCKHSSDPVLFGTSFWVAYNLANCCNIAWILLWVNVYIWVSSVLLWGIAICLVVAAVRAHKTLLVDYEQLGQQAAADAESEEAEQGPMGWLVESMRVKGLLYGLVLNGVPFYATWGVIASHLNLGIALSYREGLATNTASLTMFSVLSALILLYWTLDFWRLRRYLQFTYSPYIVLIVAFCGVLTNGRNSPEIRVFTIVLLALSCITFVAKIVMGIVLASPKNNPQRFQAV